MGGLEAQSMANRAYNRIHVNSREQRSTREWRREGKGEKREERGELNEGDDCEDGARVVAAKEGLS